MVNILFCLYQDLLRIKQGTINNQHGCTELEQARNSDNLEQWVHVVVPANDTELFGTFSVSPWEKAGITTRDRTSGIFNQ